MDYALPTCEDISVNSFNLSRPSQYIKQQKSQKDSNWIISIMIFFQSQVNSNWYFQKHQKHHRNNIWKTTGRLHHRQSARSMKAVAVIRLGMQTFRGINNFREEVWENLIIYWFFERWPQDFLFWINRDYRFPLMENISSALVQSH